MDSVTPSPVAYIDDIPIHLLSEMEIIGRAASAVRNREPLTISYVNAHVLNLARDNSALRETLIRSDICYCDGIGPVWALRASGVHVPGRHPGRVIIPKAVAEASKHQWRVGWLGGQTGIAEAALHTLQKEFPGFHGVFHGHGYASADEERLQIKRIQEAQPDILFVGMGTPKQERWVQTYRNDLDIPVIWCVGATGDYLSGMRPMGPKILLERQEWLARLMVEPKRMWRRYLVGNPRFIVRTVKSSIWNRSFNKP